MLARMLLITATALGSMALPACAQTGDAGRETDASRVARMIGHGDSWATDFSKISVRPEEIVSGGPPKDGIPAIDAPKFEAAETANRWLADREPVLVVEHGGVVKGYPLQILIWHEIVNDEVGGRPLTATFCPLCNTALVFERRLGDRILDFGTTGRLRHSDLIMYDRQTETWWQQASGEAIVGEWVGTLLDYYPANTLSWERARSLYPQIRVLSRDTGYDRAYGRNPYTGYDTGAGPIGAFFTGEPDPRYPAMERVVGVQIGGGWAVAFSELEAARVVNAETDGVAFVVLWAPGAASALDQGSIPDGRDVGQSATYRRALGDRTLTFEWTDGAFRDRETGSSWDLAGRSVAGPLEGERLEAVPHGNHFWFAWITFKTESEIWLPDR